MIMYKIKKTSKTVSSRYLVLSIMNINIDLNTYFNF